jgi:hypothetical protein
MNRLLVAIVLIPMAAVAASVKVDVDSQSTVASPLTVYEAEAGTILVRLWSDRTPSPQTNTLALFWGTNGLQSATIHTISGTISGSTAVLTYSAGDFPTNTTTRPFKYGILVGDKVWGDGSLTIKDNPTVGAGILDLYVRTVVDYASATQYQGVASSGPVRAGANISSVTNADGSVTFSLNTTIANTTNQIAALEAKTNNWNSAFGWGNHGTNGYVTAGQAVTNNAYSATIGGMLFSQSIYSYAYIQATGMTMVLKDENGKIAIDLAGSSKTLGGNDDGNTIKADFTDVFRVGPDMGTNLAVYATLTNLIQRVTALENP